MHPLRRLRRIMALTQGDLARMAGVNRATIAMFEVGKRQPHPKTIRALATALGVEPIALLKEEADQQEVEVG